MGLFRKKTFDDMDQETNTRPVPTVMLIGAQTVYCEEFKSGHVVKIIQHDNYLGSAFEVMIYHPDRNLVDDAGKSTMESYRFGSLDEAIRKVCERGRLDDSVVRGSVRKYGVLHTHAEYTASFYRG